MCQNLLIFHGKPYSLRSGWGSDRRKMEGAGGGEEEGIGINM